MQGTRGGCRAMWVGLCAAVVVGVGCERMDEEEYQEGLSLQTEMGDDALAVELESASEEAPGDWWEDIDVYLTCGDESWTIGGLSGATGGVNRMHVPISLDVLRERCGGELVEIYAVYTVLETRPEEGGEVRFEGEKRLEPLQLVVEGGGGGGGDGASEELDVEEAGPAAQ